jgi:membrane protease YdiL (CAAX protease family)
MQLRAFARHRPVLTYWLIATGLDALLVLIAFLLLRQHPNAPAEIASRSGGDLNTNIAYSLPIAAQVSGGLAFLTYMLLHAATPLIAAFVTASLLGSDRIRSLLSRYRFWAPEVGWRSGVGTWALAIGTLVGIKLMIGYLTSATSQPGTWPDFRWTADPTSPTFWFLFLTSLFFDGGGLMEETGWRGFALPELQMRWTPLRAAIILGVLWSFWHVPVNLALTGRLDLLRHYLPFTLFTVLTSIVLGYFYNRLGGSTLIGIALHGLTNDSSGLAGSIGPDLSDQASNLHMLMALVPLVIVTVVLLFIDGERLGAREERVR